MLNKNSVLIRPKCYGTAKAVFCDVTSMSWLVLSLADKCCNNNEKFYISLVFLSQNVLAKIVGDLRLAALHHRH